MLRYIILIILFSAIFFNSVTHGNEFPITCPVDLESVKTYCCKNNESYYCCDEKEFSREKIDHENDYPISIKLRSKRESYDDIYTTAEAGLGLAAIIGICVASSLPLILICCCCCCCACCPCYHWCHPSTNVTIVQSGLHYPNNNGPHNFDAGTSHDPPPRYSSGYSKMSGPSDVESNYIR